MERVWAQAAIDVEDIELAKKIAFLALDNGAEWLEVGTPLLYQYGHAAIGMLRRAVGKNAVLVADYKCPIAMLCAEQAAREGADYIMISTGYNDRLLEGNLRTCRALGVEPIFDMAVRQQDVRPTIDKLCALGGKYMYYRHYTEVPGPDGTPQKRDNMPMLTQAPKPYCLGITSDDFAEMQDAIAQGADWITFGFALRDADPASCKRWLDAIHTTPRKGQ